MDKLKSIVVSIEAGDIKAFKYINERMEALEGEREEFLEKIKNNRFWNLKNWAAQP